MLKPYHRVYEDYWDHLVEKADNILDGDLDESLNLVLGEFADCLYLINGEARDTLGGLAHSLDIRGHNDDIIDDMIITLSEMVELRRHEPEGIAARRALTNYRSYLMSQVRMTFYGEWGPCYSPLAELLHSFIFVWGELTGIDYASIMGLLTSEGFKSADVRDFLELVRSHDGQECPGFDEEMNVVKAMDLRRERAADGARSHEPNGG